jgi:molybdopterin molybdotransferase
VSAKLTEFAEARSLVLERAQPLPPQSIDLADALDRVLAEAIDATVDVPPFANSAMDGFAVRAGDSGPGVRLRVVDRSRAGAPAAATVGPGEACAISTGAAMPAGADAVVAVEDTTPGEGEVELAVAVERGRHVRGAGDDVRAGQPLLAPGVRLGPTELGVLASVGAAQVLAGPAARVSILTTGDELVAVGDPLGPGQVHNSSSLVIPALVARAGACVAAVAHARDEPKLISEAIERALAADVVVVTGGMSVGEHDHVAEAFEGLGVARHLAGVALRPGKPFWFGTRGRTLVFGLPGNPVSSLVTFLLFVRPALAKLSGEQSDPDRTLAFFDQDWPRLPTRMEAVRCRLHLRADGWHATPTGRQDSHILTSMRGAAALALIEPGAGAVAKGEAVAVELI